MNGRKILQSCPVKIRNHSDATTKYLIEYVRPIVQKNPDNDGYLLW